MTITIFLFGNFNRQQIYVENGLFARKKNKKSAAPIHWNRLYKTQYIDILLSFFPGIFSGQNWNN